MSCKYHLKIFKKYITDIIQFILNTIVNTIANTYIVGTHQVYNIKSKVKNNVYTYYFVVQLLNYISYKHKYI